jgi:hypothetical protein
VRTKVTERHDAATIVGARGAVVRRFRPPGAALPDRDR